MKQYRRFGLADWLQHIQSCHWRSIEMQLDRIATVWRRLDGRMDATVITVAGTNGKGSCVAMLEAIYTHAGLKTAAYTSPHLVHYNERFRINGVALSNRSICAAFCRIEAARQTIPLTYFEFSTLCALLLFRQAEVEVAMLEVGMGGRLDAVNMVDNDIALITRIGIDHERWLGSDRARIAQEKAGVIKPGALAVAADPDAPAAIAALAQQQNATLLCAGTDFQYQFSAPQARQPQLHWRSRHAAIPSPWAALESIPIPLAGRHQADNVSAVLAVTGLLSRRLPLTPAQLRAGLAQTRLAGRCQIVQCAPLVILDVAHNPDAAAELAAFLDQHPVAGDTYAVVGLLADKSPHLLAPLCTRVDHWYFAGLQGERGQSAQQLTAQLDCPSSYRNRRLFDRPVAAWQTAMQAAKKSDRVVIFGSFYVVGDIIAARQAAQTG